MLDIVIATPDNAEEVTDILNQAAQYKLVHNDDAWAKVPFTKEKMLQRIAGGRTYIARLDNEIVGTLQFSLEDEETWGHQPAIAAYVHQLAVKDGYHGHNLGSRLLDWAAQKAVNNGRKLLRIDVPPANKKLRNYYEKHGFKWVEDREIHFPSFSYMAALYQKQL